MVKRTFHILTSLLLVICVLTAHHPLAWSDVLREYEIKAAFLYQFTKFIQWPEGRVGIPLTVCILGRDPFGTIIDELETESGDSPKIRIRRIGRADEIENCHLLFISRTEQNRVPDVIKRTLGKNIVTVGEVAGFVEHGGIINFVRKGNHIRFEINQKQAQNEGIKISSKLLNLALQVVRP